MLCTWKIYKSQQEDAADILSMSLYSSGVKTMILWDLPFSELDDTVDTLTKSSSAILFTYIWIHYWNKKELFHVHHVSWKCTYSGITTLLHPKHGEGGYFSIV